SDMMLSQAVYDRVRLMSNVLRSDKRYATFTKWFAAASKPIGNTGQLYVKETTLQLIDRSTKEPLTVFIPNNLLWSYIVESLRANGGLERFGSIGRVASFFVARGRVDIGSKSF